MKKKINTLIKLFQKQRKKLALAESVTCGLAAHQLSMVKGTADVFQGAIVCYRPDMKCETLGINKKFIEKYTAESQQVTNALVRQLSKKIKADIYGSITGLAAPGGSENKNKPVGTIFISVLYNKKLFTDKKLFRGSPLTIKRKACIALYELLIVVIKKNIM